MIFYVACNSRINFLAGNVSWFTFMKYLFFDLTPVMHVEIGENHGMHLGTLHIFHIFHRSLYHDLWLISHCITNKMRICSTFLLYVSEMTIVKSISKNDRWSIKISSWAEYRKIHGTVQVRVTEFIAAGRSPFSICCVGSRASVDTETS